MTAILTLAIHLSCALMRKNKLNIKQKSDFQYTAFELSQCIKW